MINNPTRIVYAFPHAGANSMVYRPWVNKIPAESSVRIKPIEIPGRGVLSRENVIDDLAVLSERIAAEINADFQQQRNKGIQEWATFGHSFGGVLSMVVTSVMTKKYEIVPAFSVVSGSIAPSIQASDDRHLWTDDKILSKTKDDNGTSEAILNEATLVRRIIAQLRADYVIRRQFLQHRNMKVDHPLILVSADNDHHATTEQLNAWKKHTSKATEMISIEGDHFAVYKHFDVIYNALIRGVRNIQLCEPEQPC
ncbi:thioesterase II family protein [Photorhabdus temperata]|uniref:Thioesterase domain-containing protein n=1 Tax=Photorhabdus temperata J3 TaxID=1389415 RepID=U7QZG1_PHOTE|nr:thioesterase domain-containing protein [Photorhabdus temperata]EQB98881.1 oleoyl-ACP hydrolase [Photorhabdus temperata subsp. temperata M1021]ERT12430.1 hypothetical protein O185_14145 [Photorhabdus temperata J3]MCT8347002.1 thioesterase II family protein [Photorhabdus temperata]